MNNEEKINEGSAYNSTLKIYKNEPEALHPEIEPDKNGHSKIVQRGRKITNSLSESNTIYTEKELEKNRE